jgi:hypothetical protein
MGSSTLIEKGKMMKTTRTVYGVRPLKSDDSKAILVVREGRTIVEVKDFGFKSEFDVARILAEYSGLEFKVGRGYSTTGFRKEFGIAAKTLDLKPAASSGDSGRILGDVF